MTNSEVTSSKALDFIKKRSIKKMTKCIHCKKYQSCDYTMRYKQEEAECKDFETNFKPYFVDIKDMNINFLKEELEKEEKEEKEILIFLIRYGFENIRKVNDKIINELVKDIYIKNEPIHQYGEPEK